MSFQSFLRRSIFTALILCVLISNAFSQNLPSGVTRVTTVEGITEYHLANGLQVLLFPDQTKQNITVNIIYHVGSRHEGYGETGMEIGRAHV